MNLSHETLSEFRANFQQNDRYRLASNVVAKLDILEACVDRSVMQQVNHVFSDKVNECKPVTNQKSSGRCWVFAALNTARIPFCKENNLDDFEFSQNYLFFWDKIERANYFLNSVVEVLKRGEKPGDRLLSFLLEAPASDGGQWDMFVNLVQKHGLMPKKCFPEAQSSEASMRMNTILRAKLREFTFELNQLFERGAKDAELTAKINSQMEIIYRIVSVCLGVPPETFTWEYYDKSKQFKKVGPITPLEFYEQHVKSVYDLDTKVCLVSDPRPTNPPGRTYTVDCLGNMVGGRPTIYNNQTIDVLMEVTAKAIKAGKPVWFGCDVSKHFSSKKGILDLKLHDFQSLFDTQLYQNLDKASRLMYGASQMSHAMVFTGVHMDENNKPVKWRVENSWGEDRNEKGYIVMTNDWFREFMFEVVVDKADCTEDILRTIDTEPVVLPAWDPMGALALNKTE